MGFNDIIKALFGSKEQRDIKALKPILAKVLASYDRIDKLSNDELRSETDRLKKYISDRKAEDEASLAEIKSQLEDSNIDPEEKEALATQSDELVKKIDTEIEDALNECLPDAFAIMVQTTWPVIKKVYETQGAIYQNIAIPVSDGKKMMTVSVNLKKAYDSEGKELPRTISKTIALIMIDEFWKQQLRDMDDLKQSVQTASYEQKDPLLVYKLESYNLFEEMMDSINKGVISFLLMAHIPLRQDDNSKVSEAQQKHTDLSRMQTGHNDLAANGGQEKSNAPVHVEKKIGRNDPCPCGSGLKYKNCHEMGQKPN